MAVLSARTLVGLLAAGVAASAAEPTAWAEVRAPETAVATPPREPSLARSRLTPSPSWPYWPSAIEPRGAPSLSVNLVPPSTPSSADHAPTPLPAPEAAWLASLRLPDLPVRIDARVIEYLRFYRDSERGRAIAREWAYRSGRFLPAIQAELQRAGLPLDLAWLSLVESGHDPSIRSRAGALGLWQFMPGTARLYGLEVDRWIDERHDPELSTAAAVRFLRDLHDRFGSWELAMAAYNMGPGGLSRSIQKYNTNDYWRLSQYEAGIPWETSLYVPKIVATALVMNNRQAFGLHDVVTAVPVARDTITLEPGRTLAEVAYLAGVPPVELLRLNPQLIARRAPPASRGSHGWQVHLPPGKATDLRARLAPLGASAPPAAFVAAAPSEQAATEKVAAAAEASIAVEQEQGAAVEQGAAADPVPPPSGARVVVVPARKIHYTTRRAVFYEVVDGERLSGIAARFRVTVSELLLWNSLDPRARLQSGQVLQLFVPATEGLAGVRHLTLAEVRTIEVASPEFHAYFEGRAGRVRLAITAKQGDTLTRIGARYGIRPGVMERINQRSRRAALAPGQEVVVYVKPWRAAQIAGAAPRAPAPVPVATALSSEPVQPPSQATVPIPARAFSTEGAR